MSVPNLKEIEWAISELENEESSFSNYAKLAALYAVRDKMMPSTSRGYEAEYSMAAGPAPERIERYGDTEFLQAIAGKDMYDVVRVMDELMETLKAVNERAYTSVMRKIRAL